MSINNAKIRGICALIVLLLDWTAIACRFLDDALSFGDEMVDIAVGDLITLSSYPVIDRKHGGSVQGLLAGLNRLLDMIVPEFRTEGGTLVVPGHGRIIDDADVAYYRDMVTIIRDRVQDMIKKDMTLAQIQESKPTADWDPIYGNDASWTPDMFVESISNTRTK